MCIQARRVCLSSGRSKLMTLSFAPGTFIYAGSRTLKRWPFKVGGLLLLCTWIGCQFDINMSINMHLASATNWCKYLSCTTTSLVETKIDHGSRTHPPPRGQHPCTNRLIPNASSLVTRWCHKPWAKDRFRYKSILHKPTDELI